MKNKNIIKVDFDITHIIKKIQDRVFETSNTNILLIVTPQNVNGAKIADTEFLVKFKKEGLIFHWDDSKQIIIGSDTVSIKDKIKELKQFGII